MSHKTVTLSQQYLKATPLRITQRLLAMAVCIWHNWATGTPVKRSLISYDN